MVDAKKSKKTCENINAKLALVMKSGKYVLGYRQTLRALRKSQVKFLIVADNTPALRKSELEYYAMIGRTPLHRFKGNSKVLGTACQKVFSVGVVAITDQGDSDIIHTAPVAEQTMSN